MTMEMAVDIMRNLLQTGLILAIPILGTATVVGLLVSFVQSITSLQGANPNICSQIDLCIPRNHNFR